MRDAREILTKYTIYGNKAAEKFSAFFFAARTKSSTTNMAAEQLTLLIRLRVTFTPNEVGRLRFESVCFFFISIQGVSKPIVMIRFFHELIDD